MDDKERERLKADLTRLFNSSRGVGGAKEIYTFKLYGVWFQHSPREVIRDAYTNAKHHLNDFQEYTLDELLDLEALSKKLTFFDYKVFIDMNAIGIAVDKFIDEMNKRRIYINKDTIKSYEAKLIHDTGESIQFSEVSVLNRITNTFVFNAHEKLINGIDSLLKSICDVIEKSNDFGEFESCAVKERSKRDSAIKSYRHLLLCIIANNRDVYDLFKDHSLDFMWEPLMVYIWGAHHLTNETDIKMGIARAIKVSKFNKKENDEDE